MLAVLVQINYNVIFEEIIVLAVLASIKILIKKIKEVFTINYFEMVEANLDDMNAEIRKYQSLTEGITDTRILKSSHQEKFKTKSDELKFEEGMVIFKF
ncbi:MAG: hypothetical protein ACTSWX_16605 [Promethearchaeota archaeon]